MPMPRKNAQERPANGGIEAYLTAREILLLAQLQMACYRASAAIFTGVGMQQ